MSSPTVPPEHVDKPDWVEGEYKVLQRARSSLSVQCLRSAPVGATARHGARAGGAIRASGRVAARASSGGGTRTHNPSINSRMLCRLSYPGPSRAACEPPDRHSRAYRTRAPPASISAWQFAHSSTHFRASARALERSRHAARCRARTTSARIEVVELQRARHSGRSRRARSAARLRDQDRLTRRRRSRPPPCGSAAAELPLPDARTRTGRAHAPHRSRRARRAALRGRDGVAARAGQPVPHGGVLTSTRGDRAHESPARQRDSISRGSLRARVRRRMPRSGRAC